MKKVFITIISMLLPMMAMGQAQAGTLIAEVDFTTATEFTGWTQFDDSQTDGKVELTSEGLAITVGIRTGQLWQPSIMVIPDGSFNLAEDGDYKVVVTAKFPTDGTLQINMGSWAANDQAQFPVTATGDFQEIECDFDGWSVDAEVAHLLFQCGDFKGTTIVKSIEVYDMADGVAPNGEAQKKRLLYDNDFTGITEFTGWSQFDDSQSDGKVEADPDGVAITVGIQTGQLWQPQVMVVPDGSFNLEKNHNYFVRVTAKFPTDGILQINMGTWSANDQDQFPVTATGNFQVINCEFPGWSVYANGAHLLFDVGDFKGTTILKKIEIWEGNPQDVWTLAGDVSLFGVDWDVSYTKNNMRTTDGENYSFTMKEQMLSKGIYYFKVFKNYETDESYPRNNAFLVINEDAVYNINFIFNTNTKELSATATKSEGWTVMGDESLLGTNWNLSTDNRMNTRNDEEYTLTKTKLMLPKGTYEFKVVNIFSTQESYPSSKASLVIDENAIYTVVFTFNSNTKEVTATAKKTDGIYYNYITKAKIAEVIQNPNKYKGNIIIPEKVIYEGEEYTVTKISDYALKDCSSLTSVTIPNSVTSIGEYAFFGCGGLTSIAIPGGVTTIGNSAFSNCTRLTSIIIPNSVTSIGNFTFQSCTRLTSVSISNSIEYIGFQTFCDCSALTSVAIPNSVTTIGQGAFYGCTSLNSITIPNSVTSIGYSAFQNCSGLTSVTIGNSVTSIEDCAFSGCIGLTSITIPNSVNSIGDYAFSGCTGLSSVSIPNSVSYIYSYAFQNCSGLTSLTIGCGVNYIYSQAFANCEKLTDVYCLAENVPSTSSDAFENSYIEYATLHVPAASFSAYQNIEPWKNFQKIVAIGDGEIPETQKCATPTIKYENGIIKFSCETEGVEFISDITPAEINRKYDSEIVISNTYKVTVYATKAGYNNSDKASIEIQASSGILGDIDGDGKVNVADHVKLSDIIMKQK